MKVAILGTVASLLMAGHACAVPLTCTVSVSSPEGGRIDVIQMDAVPASPTFPLAIPAAQGIFWYPPASNSSVSLNIEYDGSRFERRDSLTNIDVELPRTEGTEAEQYRAIVSSEGLKDVHLESVGVNIVSHKYSLAFQWAYPEDRAMGKAVVDGKSINVVILKAEKRTDTEVFNGTRMKLVLLGEPKAIASVTFDTSAIAGRDRLLAQARDLIKTADPKFCKPTE